MGALTKCFHHPGRPGDSAEAHPLPHSALARPARGLQPQRPPCLHLQALLCPCQVHIYTPVALSCAAAAVAGWYACETQGVAVSWSFLCGSVGNCLQTVTSA